MRRLRRAGASRQRAGGVHVLTPTPGRAKSGPRSVHLSRPVLLKGTVATLTQINRCPNAQGGDEEATTRHIRATFRAVVRVAGTL